MNKTERTYCIHILQFFTTENINFIVVLWDSNPYTMVLPIKLRTLLLTHPENNPKYENRCHRQCNKNKGSVLPKFFFNGST